MLDALLAGRFDEFRAARAELLRRGQLERSIVGRVEAAVRANPAGAFRFSPEGEATLFADQRPFVAGAFAVRSIQALSQQARDRSDGSHRARLFGLDRSEPLLAAPLDVVVNARLIDASALRSLLRAAASRGGACLQIEAGEVNQMR